MARMRVLVVDDSAVVRRVVTNLISEDPAFEVVGQANNGRVALAMLPKVNPDIVTLDIEMPEMDGLETLTAIRRTHPRLPVVMFSTLTERGAQATLEALARGATDYATKPSGQTSIEGAMQTMRRELISKLRGLLRIEPEARPAPSAPAPVPAAPERRTTRSTGTMIEGLVIGASTGGPNALTAVVASFPEKFPVPVVIVQHMPPVFTRIFAERLDASCALTVREATDGEFLRPGLVLVAPGDYHLALVRQASGIVTSLNRQPPEQSVRPAVDVLFRSAAEVWGGHTMAVVLTGMGRDGFEGCQHLSKVGADIVVQDEASSVVWGMPGFIAKAGIARRVLDLSAIGPFVANEIAARAACILPFAGGRPVVRS